MIITKTKLAGMMLIEPQAFEDTRGYFMETHHQQKYAAAGITCTFVQDNLSYSVQNTLRGLHYQAPHSQAKLVQVIQGAIFDVAVDIRRGSPSFGRWDCATLSDTNRLQLYVPEGFAHGFCVLSPTAYVSYKCSDFYAPLTEGGVHYRDPDLGIPWPITQPLLSDKDRQFPLLKDIPLEKLPPYKP
jgi:dTDP-4-dehydrorhamnose 3,5-epimerase